MRGIWNSVLGERLWHWLRGADFHDPEFKRKSLGKQHVLAPKYRTREQAFCVALKLLHISATNLRKLKMWAGGIGAGVKFLKKRPVRFSDEGVDAPEWKAHMRIPECRDTVNLQRQPDGVVEFMSGTGAIAGAVAGRRMVVQSRAG